MENIRLGLIRLLEVHGVELDARLIEGIAELFYSHQSDLEETVRSLQENQGTLLGRIHDMSVTISEHYDSFLDISLKYADALAMIEQQHEAEQHYKEKEIREGLISDDTST